MWTDFNLYNISIFFLYLQVLNSNRGKLYLKMIYKNVSEARKKNWYPPILIWHPGEHQASFFNIFKK